MDWESCIVMAKYSLFTNYLFSVLVFPCLLSGEDHNTTDYRDHRKDCECVCKILRIVSGIWTCSVSVSFSVESSSVSGYIHACKLTVLNEEGGCPQAMWL